MERRGLSPGKGAAGDQDVSGGPPAPTVCVLPRGVAGVVVVPRPAAHGWISRGIGDSPLVQSRVSLGRTLSCSPWTFPRQKGGFSLPFHPPAPPERTAPCPELRAFLCPSLAENVQIPWRKGRQRRAGVSSDSMNAGVGMPERCNVPVQLPCGRRGYCSAFLLAAWLRIFF